MTVSIRTNAPKKQLQNATSEKALASVLSELENACVHILDAPGIPSYEDTDALYWQRRLKNVATPVSLALRECKGPRRFHYHYRHDPEDYETMKPVMGPTPLTMLSRVCERALAACADFHMLRDASTRRHFMSLESALREFLQHYKAQH